jgi:hypothetical protein
MQKFMEAPRREDHPSADLNAESRDAAVLFE